MEILLTTIVLVVGCLFWIAFGPGVKGPRV